MLHAGQFIEGVRRKATAGFLSDLALIFAPARVDYAITKFYTLSRANH
jgi:hypothetical protein